MMKIEEKTNYDNHELENELSSQFALAETAHREVRDTGFTWDEREEYFFGKKKRNKEDPLDSITTGELTTLVVDSSCRVMAQMPTGRFYNYNGETGANMLMNLLYEHYVAPNATTGGSLLLKFRLANLYSRIFPAVPIFVEWKVSENYIGPDPVIIHPRRFRPQPGKNSIEDMEWCFIDTEVSREWLKKQDKQVWKNIDIVLKTIEEGGGVPEEDRSFDEKGKTKTGITLRHRFSANGDWVCYEPQSGKVLLEEKEYYPGIPIAIKQQYPKMDSLWGLTDFDRGFLTQKMIDATFKMYFEGLAMSFKPPKVIDPEQVVLSSIVSRPGTKWFVKNGNMDAVKMLNISPQGLATFQSTYQVLKANLLSLGATTDTSVARSVDPGMGKTPQALKMQSERMGSRDAWDVFMQEQFIQRTNTIIADMLAKKGVKPYAFNLLGNSIKRIQEQYPDEDLSHLLGKNYDTGRAEINQEIVRGRYRYIIDEGSILAKDDTGKRLLSYIEIYNKYPGIQEDFANNRQKFNQGEAFKRALIDEGIKDSEKIIVTEQQPESVEDIGDEGSTLEIPPQTAETLPPNYQI